LNQLYNAIHKSWCDNHTTRNGIITVDIKELLKFNIFELDSHSFFIRQLESHNPPDCNHGNYNQDTFKLIGISGYEGRYY